MKDPLSTRDLIMINPFPNKNYLTVKEAAELLDLSARHVQRKIKDFETKTITDRGGKKFLIKTESVIAKMNPARRFSLYNDVDPKELAQNKLHEHELAVYSNLPEWKRKKAMKYLSIINAAEGLTGKKLEEFITEWNNKYPDNKVSIKSFYREYAKYKDGGVQALFAGYGSNEGATKIEEDDFNYFCNLYLKEGGPTLKACWLETYGNHIKRNFGVIPDSFPAMSSFYRLLKKRIPTQSIIRARKGERYWNNHYASSLDRDWSKVRAGQCWFSDHRQADQAIMRMMPKDRQGQILRLIKYEGKDKSKPVFPWITFWADAKTKKILSILPHEEEPNSDHIFSSFYLAVNEFGLPDEIYIDNGKDYRCRDFAGGRRKIKVEVDEIKTRSLMHYLGIEIHFSRPYRGQSKTIERTFRIMKEWFDKQMPGYRGGNIVERPEKLVKEIKNCSIMDFAEYCDMINYFFKEIYNQFESNGNILMGRSPEQIWNEEFTVKRTIDKESLKLLCMRSSKDYSIGKHGIVVSQKYNIHYWSDWMIALKNNKRKYYMRRDPKQYQFAWVFDSKTDEYIGKAELNVWKTDALAKTDLEKAQLEAVLKRQAIEKKVVNSYLPYNDIDPHEILENLAAGIALTSQNAESKKAETINVYVRTQMDEVQQKQLEMQRTGTYGFSSSRPGKGGTKIFSFLTDAERKEKADHSRPINGGQAGKE